GRSRRPTGTATPTPMKTQRAIGCASGSRTRGARSTTLRLRAQGKASAEPMAGNPVGEGRTCKQPLMQTGWGLMGRRGLRGWQRVGDHWSRPFAEHAKNNPDERRYLEKYGQPGALD